MAIEYLQWLLVNHMLDRAEYQEKMKDFVAMIPVKYASKLENEVYPKVGITIEMISDLFLDSSYQLSSTVILF